MSEPTKTQQAVSDFIELVASGEHIISMLPMETVDVAGAELVVDLPFNATLSGPRGHLQGGVTATLADMVGGRLAMKGLDPSQLVVTTDLTVHYLAGIQSGLARAIGATLRSSPSSRTIRVDIYDGIDGPLAATCTLAFRVVTSG